MRSPALADADLSDAERRLLDVYLGMLEERMATELRSVWLYGSRARGERLAADSDVDLLIVLGEYDSQLDSRAQRMLFEAAKRTGGNPITFSARVWDTGRVAHEREIDSFFIREVDRDKIVLAGDP